MKRWIASEKRKTQPGTSSELGFQASALPRGRRAAKGLAFGAVKVIPRDGPVSLGYAETSFLGIGLGVPAGRFSSASDAAEVVCRLCCLVWSVGLNFALPLFSFAQRLDGVKPNLMASPLQR